MPLNGNNIFLKQVLANLPRLLAQLNRNVLSSSYGSFDRAFWHYRTNDISNARYQEAALTLALLHQNNFNGNIYYGNKQILEWLNATLAFTLSIQNKDGSFNEWYVNERSYVATSFVAAAVAETLLVLEKVNIKEYEKILAGLERAANWLLKHTEELVYNQLAGSVLALAKIAHLTGKEKYSEASRGKFKIIEKNQSAEGWWSEYGGPDVGYLSLMIDYLTKYYELEKSENILDCLKKASAFLVNFLHPNLTAGGEYMSRNTEYIIPSGLAYLSRLDKNSEIITAFNLSALASGASLGPSQLDDRYLSYILYNWLQAGLNLGQSKNELDLNIHDYLSARRMDIFYKDSGLRVMQNDKYYFVANLYKGGVFRLYAANKFYLDSGVEIKYKEKNYISNVLDYENKFIQKDNYLAVNGALKPVKDSLMKTGLMIMFKFYQLTLGKIGSGQVLLKSFLRKKMITYHDSAGISFKREFIFNDNSLTVKDEIGAPILDKNFYCGLKTSYNFIPSAKYFSVQEINNQANSTSRNFDCTDKTSRQERVLTF